MSALNPERVFRIQMPARPPRSPTGTRAARRRATCRSDAGRLDAANALLPGRINLYQLSPELDAALGAAADAGARRQARRRRRSASRPRPSSSRRPAATTASRDGAVEAIEFTAIYPAGTVDGDDHVQGRDSCPTSASPASGRSSARTQGPRPPRHGRLPLAESRLRLHHHAAVPVRRRHRLQRLPQRRRALRAQRDAVPAERVAQGRGRARRQEAVPEPLDRQPRTDLARLHAARLRPHERAAPDRARRAPTCWSEVDDATATCRSATTSSTSTATARPRSWACSTTSPTEQRAHARSPPTSPTSASRSTAGSTATTSRSPPVGQATHQGRARSAASSARRPQEAQTLHEPAALRGDVRRPETDPVLHAQARRLRQQPRLRAQPRAAQGRRRPHDRSGEALPEVIEAYKKSSPQITGEPPFPTTFCTGVSVEGLLSDQG